MFHDATGFDHVYVAAVYTALRRGIDSLVSIIGTVFELIPYQNCLFLFCGRRTNRIKAILWEEDGFVLLFEKIFEKSQKSRIF